jgi:hypothetical protein
VGFCDDVQATAGGAFNQTAARQSPKRESWERMKLHAKKKRGTKKSSYPIIVSGRRITIAAPAIYLQRALRGINVQKDVERSGKKNTTK